MHTEMGVIYDYGVPGGVKLSGILFVAVLVSLSRCSVGALEVEVCMMVIIAVYIRPYDYSSPFWWC